MTTLPLNHDAARVEPRRDRHPQDDPPRQRARRRQPLPGLRRLRHAGGGQGGGAQGDRRRQQPVLLHLRHPAPARGDRRKALPPSTASTDIDPEDIVVTLGATEAIMSVLKTVGNPGDEVVFFEPFHEAYVPQCAVLGLRAARRHHRHGDDDLRRSAALEAAITDRTVAILLNTPHNPSGKVFTCEELQHIAELAQAPQLRRDHGRDLRAHPLRRGEAHQHRHAARHARAHLHLQRDVEDLRGDRLAHRLDDLPARLHALRPRHPRHHRRPGADAPADRRRHRPEHAR